MGFLCGWPGSASEIRWEAYLKGSSEQSRCSSALKGSKWVTLWMYTNTTVYSWQHVQWSKHTNRNRPLKKAIKLRCPACGDVQEVDLKVFILHKKCENSCDISEVLNKWLSTLTEIFNVTLNTNDGRMKKNKWKVKLIVCGILALNRSLNSTMTTLSAIYQNLLSSSQSVAMISCQEWDFCSNPLLFIWPVGLAWHEVKV